jgi:hypothetical protein
MTPSEYQAMLHWRARVSRGDVRVSRLKGHEHVENSDRFGLVGNPDCNYRSDIGSS